MIAVAMVNNKPEMVLDYHQLLDDSARLPA